MSLDQFVVGVLNAALWPTVFLIVGGRLVDVIDKWIDHRIGENENELEKGS